MNDYDVVVVGGRVAGASTALLLARAGLRVLVVERSGTAATPCRPTRLMRAGVLQLSRWGVLPELVARPAPRRSAEPSSTTPTARTGASSTIRPTRRASTRSTHRAGYLLDQLLVEAAAAAGADVLHENRS